MNDYSRYTEKREWVTLYNPKEKVDCIVTTFYDGNYLYQYAREIRIKPFRLSVGEDVIVKHSGHKAKIKEVKDFNEEFNYKLTETCYVIDPPDPKGGPWYFRRNLF